MKFDANGWLDTAIEVDILENTFSRQGYQPKFIVLHGTAGGSSAEDVANYMKSTVGSNNPVSTHFVIGQDGHIVQCVPLSLAAWGNGVLTTGHAAFLPENVNPNLLTLASIEFVKASTDNSDALTPTQEDSGYALIQCICDNYGIPKRTGDADGGIIRHADIDPVNRARCPGTFNYGNLWNYLANGGNTMNIPTGWKDDGSVLTAPNGVQVRLGFRDHVLNSNWDPANTPLEPEQHLSILEQSNPGLGAGQRQIFRSKSLEYTPIAGVFEGWIGQELLWYQKQHALLLAQITTLQGEIAALQALPIVANMEKIQTIGQTIKDDVDLIMKLAQIQ